MALRRLAALVEVVLVVVLGRVEEHSLPNLHGGGREIRRIGDKCQRLFYCPFCAR